MGECRDSETRKQSPGLDKERPGKERPRRSRTKGPGMPHLLGFLCQQWEPLNTAGWRAKRRAWAKGKEAMRRWGSHAKEEWDGGSEGNWGSGREGRTQWSGLRGWLPRNCLMSAWMTKDQEPRAEEGRWAWNTQDHFVQLFKRRLASESFQWSLKN